MEREIRFRWILRGGNIRRTCALYIYVCLRKELRDFNEYNIADGMDFELHRNNVKYQICKLFTKQYCFELSNFVLSNIVSERKRKKEKYITMSWFFEVTSHQAIKYACKYFLGCINASSVERDVYFLHKFSHVSCATSFHKLTKTIRYRIHTYQFHFHIYYFFKKI